MWAKGQAAEARRRRAGSGPSAQQRPGRVKEAAYLTVGGLSEPGRTHHSKASPFYCTKIQSATCPKAGEKKSFTNPTLNSAAGYPGSIKLNFAVRMGSGDP